MVNNVTDASLQETLTESGYTLTEFDYIGDNGYYDIYQGLNNTGAVDYIEHVFWDRSHVVKILAIVNDVNYAKIKDELWFAINSAEWTYEDPITPGYYLNYQLYGDFEFAIPDTWQFSSTDSSLYAYDEQSGAMMTVNVLEDPSMLSDITQIDYNNFLSLRSESNFMLNVFQQYSDYIYGEATYDNNGVATALAQTYYANGTYQYIITYEFPTAYADPYYQISVDGLSLTRIFYDSSNETESTDTAQSDSSESIMGKTFGAGTAQETTPKETEPADGRAIGTFSLDDQKNNPSQRYGNLDNLMDEDSSQEDFDRKFDKYSSSEASSQPADGTQEAPAGNTDTGVSTVADAFVQVAGISQEKAQALSSAWYSLNLGDPVEAEAYKGNDTSLILLVTNQVGVDYYIYITKEGDLQDIRMNNEEGPSVLNSQPQQ